MGEADLVGGVESDGAVERGAGGRRGGGGRGGRGEASGVSVGEADALVEHERGVHELKAHILVVGLEVNEEGAGLLEGEGEASQGRTVGEGGLGGGGLKAEVAGGGGEGGGGRGLVALVAALERGLHLPFQSADCSWPGSLRRPAAAGSDMIQDIKHSRNLCGNMPIKTSSC